MREKGLVHIPIVLVLIVIVAAGTAALINQGNHQDVKGTLIAKEGGDSGSSGSKSSGSSDSGSRDSGSSGSSSSSGSSGSSSSGGGSSGSSGGSSSSGSSGSSGSSSGGSGETKTTEVKETKKKVEVEKVEKRGAKREVEVKKETEVEVEIENEIEKPEVKEVEFKVAQGEIEVETKQATGAAEARRHGKSKKLAVNLTQKKGEKEVKLEAAENHFKIEVKGVETETHFPLSINKTTGQLFVRTGKGLREIRLLPDQAAQRAREVGILAQIEKIELIENEIPNTPDDVVVKVKGQRVGNLLGFIPVRAEVETEIGAQTESIVKVNEPFWLRILSRVII